MTKTTLIDATSKSQSATKKEEQDELDLVLEDKEEDTKSNDASLKDNVDGTSVSNGGIQKEDGNTDGAEEDEDEKVSSKDDGKKEADENYSKGKTEKKRAAKKPPKRKNKDKAEESEEPKAKKPRVKPEKALEVKNKLIDELATNYSLGVKEMPMDVLAKAVGYRHPRSDAILAALKLLKEDGIALKTHKTNTCQLTEKGVKEHVQEEEPAANPEAAMEMYWKQLVLKLDNTPKANSAKARENAQNIWELLQDGKAHSIEEVLGVTSYGMVRSTGFPEILKSFQVLGLATKENKHLQFTDKVFPFGRP